MTKAFYGMIEMGDRQKDMDLSIAVGLAKVFEVSIDYIIAEEEKLKSSGAVWGGEGKRRGGRGWEIKNTHRFRGGHGYRNQL